MEKKACMKEWIKQAQSTSADQFVLNCFVIKNFDRVISLLKNWLSIRDYPPNYEKTQAEIWPHDKW